MLCLRCGKLVHIDFGYILGRDPKPLPPPMKLSKEMIEGTKFNQSMYRMSKDMAEQKRTIHG